MAQVPVLLTAFLAARLLTLDDLLRIESLGPPAPSPDGQWVAQTRVRPRLDSPRPANFLEGRDRSDIWLYHVPTRRWRKLTNGAFTNSGFFSPVWSPDSRHLALLATTPDGIRLWLWPTGSARPRQLSSAAVEASDPLWLNTGEIVCASPPPGQQAGLFELDFGATRLAPSLWREASTGTSATVSALSTAPVAIPQGELLAFSLRKSLPRRIATGNFTSLRLSPGFLEARRQTGFLEPDPGKQLPNINPILTEPFRYPLPGAQPISPPPLPPGFIPQSINPHLREITPGPAISFPVLTRKGATAYAWLLLPPHAQPGQRFPTVVSVYPGLVHDAQTSPRLELGASRPFHPQLFAARGYAVLFPGIPLGPEGQPSNPLSDIADAVLPALDRAIELGHVDPQRLALHGHSFGGYGVLALIAQTRRFHAAIALAAPTNLASLYGQLDQRARYSPLARNRLLFLVFSESGQFRMAAPPWADPGRYSFNSPITYANQIETPLLLLQGDQDYVPLSQGEELFSALWRQRKPVEFARYWGEGHTIESPANIRDAWQRIFSWLDRYLTPTPATPVSPLP